MGSTIYDKTNRNLDHMQVDKMVLEMAEELIVLTDSIFNANETYIFRFLAA